MRARLALHISGVAYAHREVALKAKPPEMLSASPKGTVPVLCLPTGQVIEQSLDIMQWALAQNDPAAWLPSSPEAKVQTQALIAQNDGAFKTHLDRYKYPQRFGLSDGVAHRTLAAEWLMRLEHGLQAQATATPHAAHLTGPHWGLADACLAPFVRQFARTDRAWFDAQPWPHLAAWLLAFENSALLDAVMHKHPVWVGASVA